MNSAWFDDLLDSAGSNFGRVISLLLVRLKQILGDSFRCNAYDDWDSSSVSMQVCKFKSRKKIISSTIKLKNGRNSYLDGSMNC